MFTRWIDIIESTNNINDSGIKQIVVGIIRNQNKVDVSILIERWINIILFTIMEIEINILINITINVGYAIEYGYVRINIIINYVSG